MAWPTPSDAGARGGARAPGGARVAHGAKGGAGFVTRAGSCAGRPGARPGRAGSGLAPWGPTDLAELVPRRHGLEQEGGG